MRIFGNSITYWKWRSVSTGHRHDNIVVWRQFMVTDGIDSKRRLFHSSHSLNTAAERRGPRKRKYDQPLGRDKLYVHAVLSTKHRMVNLKYAVNQYN